MFKGILVGLGGRGLHWANETARHENCELVAWVEPDDANCRRAVATARVPPDRIFSTLTDALKDVEADFVLDVTPPSVHHEIAREAFDAGLHLLGEKPLSDDLGTARKVAEAGTKAGVTHMVAQNYRFDNCARTLRQVLAEGIIGTPGQCDVQFYKAWADLAGSHYVTQPFMLINDMMVHHFDLMRYVLGEDPLAVQAITWNHPWGWHQGDAAHAIVFEFANNVRATHVSVGCSVGETRRDYFGDWRVDGAAGSLSWSEGRIWKAHLHRTAEPVRREVFAKPVPQQAQGILGEFFAAIAEDRDPECSAVDNLKSLAMVFGAIRSAKEQRRVELAELES